MIGSTSRLPLLNTIFGRRLPNHVPPTRPIFFLIRERDRATFGCPTSSRFSPRCSGLSCARDCVCPLHFTESGCECGAALDKCGRHRGACPPSGRLKSQAERTLARACREAGGTVRTHVKLRDLNTTGRSRSSHQVCRCTMAHNWQSTSPLDQLSRRHNSGEGAGEQREQIHELLDGGRCQLVVVGLETGVEALNFIECLAFGRAREATPLLRRSSFLGWRRRWTRMLSISCSRAFAGSLISSQAD